MTSFPDLKKTAAVLILVSVLGAQLVLPLQTAKAGGLALSPEVAGPPFIFGKESILDTIARILARTLVRALLDTTISWIRGGGGKNVGFIGNLEKEMRRQLDMRGAEFLNRLAGVNMCGNIGLNLQFSLRLPSAGTRLDQKFQCTVTGIVKNLDNFFRSFKNGGWPVFVEIAIIPQNDPFGAYIKASLEKIRVEENLQQSITQKYQAGSQFLGTQKLEYSNCEEEDGALDCITEYKTVTPGSAIKDALSKAVGVDLDWLISADEINEVIIAIVNTLLQQLITKALFDDDFGDGWEQEKTNPSQGVVEQAEKAMARADEVIAFINSQIAELKKELAALDEACKKDPVNCDQQRIDEINKEIADLEAKIKELEALKTQLADLKSKAQAATSPTELEAILKQISDVRIKIEQINQEVGGPPPTS